MINKVDFEKEVRDVAKCCFADLHKQSQQEIYDNLKYFAEKSKKIAEGVLEQYIFANFEKYTEGDFAITDIDISRFCDFDTGYQHQMLSWIEAHPLEVKEEAFALPENPFASQPERHSVSPKAIITGGTIISIGLFIFSDIWIGLAAEVLTLGLAKTQSMRIFKNKRQQQMEFEHYTAAIEDKKNRLVNGMINDLIKWLDLGVAKSEKLISTYTL